MMSHSHYSSNTRYIAISGILFRVFPLSNVGSILDKYPQFLNNKNRNVYSCSTTEYGCVLECIYISNHPKEYRELKGNKKQIKARIKEQYFELYGDVMPEDYKGEVIEIILPEVSNLYNTIFKIFTINKSGAYELIKTYKPNRLEEEDEDEDTETLHIENKSDDDESYEENETDAITEKRKITNLLLLTDDENNWHLMFIKDVDNLTKCHVCPKCHEYCLSASNNRCYDKKLFDKHVASCTGRARADLRLYKVAVPDIQFL
jgi:hypothetical protein